ncbi:hypothetical protein ACUOCP_31120 [Escherichia sp. R-CC3]
MIELAKRETKDNIIKIRV